ncbi:MAG: dTDP-4-dehydrorhamnose 3,5-epimerase [Elusimicrobia bacterium]|nr:dTDP-4-dehydrorhamnose 3,5-epimerase [Elusimicrobiota bacterium]
MSFKFQKLEIPDLILIEPQILRDERGFFTEIMKTNEFEKAGIKTTFAQLNHSKSSKGVLRGVHFQKKPMAQGKLVRVLEGEIFDVAVDIRRKSQYYGKYVSINLNEKDMKLIYIPEGFAHGFCVLSDTAQIEYFCTNIYSPKDEGGIIYNDPDLNINWPIKNPLISSKDSKYGLFKDLDSGF